MLQDSGIRQHALMDADEASDEEIFAAACPKRRPLTAMATRHQPQIGPFAAGLRWARGRVQPLDHRDGILGPFPRLDESDRACSEADIADDRLASNQHLLDEDSRSRWLRDAGLLRWLREAGRVSLLQRPSTQLFSRSFGTASAGSRAAPRRWCRPWSEAGRSIRICSPCESLMSVLERSSCCFGHLGTQGASAWPPPDRPTLFVAKEKINACSSIGADELSRFSAEPPDLLQAVSRGQWYPPFDGRERTRAVSRPTSRGRFTDDAAASKISQASRPVIGLTSSPLGKTVVANARSSTRK